MPRKTTPAEQARLKELEEVIDKILLAPAPGGATVISPMDWFAPPKILAAFRSRHSALVALGQAHNLLASVTGAFDAARCDDGYAADRERRLEVRSILILWREIPAGRLFLQLWGDEIINCRGFRHFSCPLGDFPSATHAVQHLAEAALAEMWQVADKANDPAATADDEGPFEVGDCTLPSFSVDWWYAALPALHRHYKGAPATWELDTYPGCWDAGLGQEVAAIRSRLDEAKTSSGMVEGGATPSAALPGEVEQYMERVAQAVGDDNTAAIMAIANRKDWSGERRMREILRLDGRFAGKDSNEWATLLGVSAAAVRGYATWKALQHGKTSAD
jgi:hypothetical protein